ncbi:hypothetical protein [Actinotalea caeni]|uniref:hypothetical protein n=1 Tax=Actinotalea caeni TaxID=1348467 RepID=UPI0012E1090E|nr:hypothetical protein [Actinotalea caeni]
MSQIDTFSHGVSGQLSHDDKGELLHFDDLAAPLAQVWVNFDTFLPKQASNR